MALLTMRGILSRVVLLITLALAACPAAEPVTTKEYLVKAAFLFHFTQFVEWPETAFATVDAPIRIGVIGKDPFGAALDETVRGETVRQRRIEIRRAQVAAELTDCHLVFIPHSESVRIDEIAAQLGEAPVLIVTDAGGTGEHGVISFYLDGPKVRFEVNPAAALRRKVKVSAQLLGLARIVGPAVQGPAP